MVEETKVGNEVLSDSTQLKIGDEEPYVHAEEFKQVKHIGKGQYGDVWKMEHAKLPCMIAVKKIVLNTSLNEKERRRWKREIEVLRKSVDHPHTVTFYGALVHNVSLKYIPNIQIPT